MGVLNHLFSVNLVTMILALPISYMDWKDIMVWRNSKLSMVYLKDIAFPFFSHNPTDSQQSFHWIWQLKIPPRI